MISDFRGDSDAEFGARLRAEREALGLAVHELAHKVGFTDLAQKQMEAGAVKIPIDYLQALDKYTEINVLDLIREKTM